jgi:endonuclease YncB( thermonuclease family)
LRHRHGHRIGCALAAVFCAGGVAAQPQAPASHAACRLETFTTGTVQAALDGRTLLLADRREVRLIGVEVPQANERGTSTGAKAALETLLAGREVTLKRPGTAERDRHGRLLAFVHAAENAGSAQQALIAGGHARVAARIGDMACAAPLLAAERTARAGRLGLWADPYYVMRRAENPAEILAEKGRFALVEGRVLSVRESGGTIYVNFGRRWSEDFTVTVLKRSERAFTDAGLELKKLSGRRVRVRGFIEERGGPWIEASRPEQIEIAERN